MLRCKWTLLIGTVYFCDICIVPRSMFFSICHLNQYFRNNNNDDNNNNIIIILIREQ